MTGELGGSFLLSAGSCLMRERVILPVITLVSNVAEGTEGACRENCKVKRKVGCVCERQMRVCLRRTNLMVAKEEGAALTSATHASEVGRGRK